jgi:cysteine desulfurase
MFLKQIIQKSLINYMKLSKNLFATNKVIYLDYQATTPIDYRVLDAMLPYMTQYYGNPHSKTHQFGWDTSKGVEVAREQIADLISADPKEIIFTSGATESNNQVLKGLAAFYGHERKHIITTQIEHKCILDTCRNLELQGYTVTYLPLKNNGILDLQVLKKTIDESKEKVLCVSTMFVNN